MSEVKQKTRLIPVTRWNDYFPYPTVGGWRHLIFNAKTNGFDAVIRRVGRSVLVDETKFFEFVNRTGGKP